MPRDNDDICPHCDVAFAIVRVRFRLTGTKLLFACPSCELTQVDARLAIAPTMRRSVVGPAHAPKVSLPSQDDAPGRMSDTF
jgi:hypothetical protein